MWSRSNDPTQRVRLLARGATGGPDAGLSSFSCGACGYIRKHTGEQYVEYAPVPRDGDAATVVKGSPLRRIGLQPLSIGREISEPEVSYTMCNPPVDLAAHLAETGPAQIEVRQSPLKEGYAIGVLHLLLARCCCDGCPAAGAGWITTTAVFLSTSRPSLGLVRNGADEAAPHAEPAGRMDDARRHALSRIGHYRVAFE